MKYGASEHPEPELRNGALVNGSRPVRRIERRYLLVSVLMSTAGAILVMWSVLNLRVQSLAIVAMAVGVAFSVSAGLVLIRGRRP